MRLGIRHTCSRLNLDWTICAPKSKNNKLRDIASTTNASSHEQHRANCAQLKLKFIVTAGGQSVLLRSSSLPSGFKCRDRNRNARVQRTDPT